MSTSKIVLGVLAGVAVGGALGVLLAPQKGWRTRKIIADKSDEYADSLKEKFDDFIDSISRKSDQVQDEVSDFAEDVKAKVKDAGADKKAAKS